METEVLVAGAGPVGLAMAAELARYGVTVRIVDPAVRRSDKSKALVLWSRTLELMDRMGCTGSFVAAGLKAAAANIVAGAEQVAHITLGGVATPYPYALMLPQSETERLLEGHLTSLGISIEREVELAQFTDFGDRVLCTLRHSDGQEEKLETSWLIGCDGAHSAVRHELGIGFTGDTLPSEWMLADLHLAGAPDPGEINILWHAEGILAIFPITQDRFRVIADLGTSSGGTRPDPTLDEVQEVLDRRGAGGIRASEPVWLARFHINERKVADYRVGRVFLAGDAAHIHSPASGQGMNTGIQDACNLAWKLALVCRGACVPEPLLESYSIERSAVGDQVLKGAGRLTALAILRGGTKQAIRNHIAALAFGLAPVRRMAADALTEVSIGYDRSPLNGTGGHNHGGPIAGERAPIREDESPVGAGNRPRFVLFAKQGDAAAELIALYPEFLEAEVRKPYHEGGLWLVRPDGYVALAADADKWDEVAEYLGRISKSHG